MKNHGHGNGLRHGTLGRVVSEMEREKEAVKKDLRGEVWELPLKKRYRAHKNGDVEAQREQLPEEEQSRGERERRRGEWERNINLKRGRSRFFSLGIIVILKSQLGYFCKMDFENKKTPIFMEPQFVLYCQVQARLTVVNLGWFDR